MYYFLIFIGIALMINGSFINVALGLIGYLVFISFLTIPLLMAATLSKEGKPYSSGFLFLCIYVGIIAGSSIFGISILSDHPDLFLPVMITCPLFLVFVAFPLLVDDTYLMWESYLNRCLISIYFHLYAVVFVSIGFTVFQRFY